MNVVTAQEAVALADKVWRGEVMTRRERDQLAKWVFDQASKIFKPKSPSHRPAKHADRNFYATMDYMVHSESDTLEVVGSRWNLEGKALSTIMSRDRCRWKKEVQAEFNKVPDKQRWAQLVEIMRRRILQKSESSVVGEKDRRK